jgi:hypothetical protein
MIQPMEHTITCTADDSRALASGDQGYGRTDRKVFTAFPSQPSHSGLTVDAHRVMRLYRPAWGQTVAVFGATAS